MSVQVFVSYSRKDIALTKSIVAFLEQQFVVWWDDDIVGGTDFTNDIFKKIQKTQVAVVVWSANAATSEWVQNESQAAVELCPCIPILLDDTPLPPHLARFDAIDLRSWDGCNENRELRKLAQDITLHVAHASKPTGVDIARFQVPERDKTATAEFRILGVLLYVAAVATCCSFIDWRNPLGNIYIVIVLAAAHAPLLLHLGQVLIRGPKAFLFLASSLAWGGLLALGATIAIFFLSDAFPHLDLAKPGLNGHEAAIGAKLDASDSRRLKCRRYIHSGDYEQAPLESPSDKDPKKLDSRVAPLRPLTHDEKMRAFGCVNDDWTNVRPSTTIPFGIQGPPFLVEFPDESDWSQPVKDLLIAGKYNEAYSLLRTASDPAAMNVRAVLDANQLGWGSDPGSAFINFRIALSRGYAPARANLGLCYLFGIGTRVDPKYGGELLRQAISEGLAPQKARWLLKNGFSFSERGHCGGCEVHQARSGEWIAYRPRH
jgi:hypothetical protein